MPRKVLAKEELIKLQKEFHKELKRLHKLKKPNFSRQTIISNLAKKYGISPSTAFGHTVAVKIFGYKSYVDYQRHLRWKEGLSLSEYKRKLAVEKGYATYSAYSEYSIEKSRERQKRPENQALGRFILEASSKQRKKFSQIARETKISHQRLNSYAQGKTIPQKSILKKLFKVLAPEENYKTIDDLVSKYAKSEDPFLFNTNMKLKWDVEKPEIPENKILSNFLKRKLKELRKNNTWLANKLKVSNASVGFYVRGLSMPSKYNLEDLFSIIAPDKNYKTINDLIKDELENPEI